MKRSFGFDVRPGLPYAIAVLLGVGAWGGGGYTPWGALVLQIGATSLFALLVISTFLNTPRGRRRARAPRPRRTFWARHPELGAVIRWMSLGSLASKATDVEIHVPGENTSDEPEVENREPKFLGCSFRRTAFGAPLLGLTVWIALSLVPLPQGWLSMASPTAADTWSAAERLISDSTLSEPSPEARTHWPTSLTPFYSARNLWLWLAFLALFYLGVEVAAVPSRLDAFIKLMFALGLVYGIWGAGQWLVGMQELMGNQPGSAGLRATGPFGNRNHYAAFVELLMLCCLGFLGALKARQRIFGGGRRHITHEQRAQFFLAGLGFVGVALGLVFSLSRSGISFAILGCASFALLSLRYGSSTVSSHGGVEEREDVVDVEARESRRHRRRAPTKKAPSRRWLSALAMAVVAVVLFVGVAPIVERFELLPEELEAERGRAQVYRESVGIIGDFWLTGSGLGSFGHVFPAYRSFGGEIFYSWAHNDYLQLGIELGIPGLFFLAWLVVLLVGRILIVREELADRPDLGHTHSGFVAALVTIGLHSFTDFSLHMPAVMALLSVIVGVVVGMRAEPLRIQRRLRRGIA